MRWPWSKKPAPEPDPAEEAAAARKREMMEEAFKIEREQRAEVEELIAPWQVGARARYLGREVWITRSEVKSHQVYRSDLPGYCYSSQVPPHPAVDISWISDDGTAVRTVVLLTAEALKLLRPIEGGGVMVGSNNLRGAIQQTINSHSAEAGSNTPDFILAEYLTDCLAAFDRAVAARERWYQ